MHSPNAPCRLGRLRTALGLLAVTFAVDTTASAQVAPSIVRVVNQEIDVDPAVPWNITGPWESGGSAFLIGDGRILTNAHVIARSRIVLVYLHDDPEPHEARIVVAGHDCDLALLELVDPAPARALPQLAFGDLPEIGSEVETYGYPEGGQRMSSTRGVVSRVEVNTYVHTGVDRHLAVQTDAAINPGNSGGPVIQDGRVVGVAFQGQDDLDNVGFFIPVEVIRHFLRDAEDGKYDGFPVIGVWRSTMLSPAARRKAGMRRGESGVQVHGILPRSSADGHLQVGDVLMKMDGVDIADDGTVKAHGLRLDHHVLVDKLQVGEETVLDVLRGGERIQVRFAMKAMPKARKLGYDYDELPRYFVYGGLVFAPMAPDFLHENPNYEYEVFVRGVRDKARMSYEPVVLLDTLTHSVNSGMPWRDHMVVDKVNGVTIRSLEHLVQVVEGHDEQFQVFEYGLWGRFGVLDRQRAERAGPEILEDYGIAKDRRL